MVDASTYELHPEASAYLHYLLGSAPGPKRGQQSAADNGAQTGRTVRGAGSSNWHHNQISSEPSPYYLPVA